MSLQQTLELYLKLVLNGLCINYTKDLELLAAATAGAIDVAAGYLHTETIQNHLDEQQKYYKKFYSWDKKAMEWENFLKGALSVKQ